MVEIIGIFKSIAENYGEPVAITIIIIGFLGYSIY